MRCYFFHIENGHRISGEVGEEFPDDRAALQEAEVIADDLSKNQISPNRLKVIVTDDTGKQVGEVPLIRKVR